MAPQGGSRGGVGEIDDKDAKHLLDSIGEKVYKEKVKNGANDFSDELKGNLNTASGSGGELASTTDTCALVEQYRSKADTKSERNPCKELSGKVEPRFSDTLGGQCTNEKMRSGGKGACAPYRRLHLCHHNLETIETTSTTKHDLLAEVCYAAKEEGESLKNYHAQYQTENTDFKTNICTVLARSFADIGDIIRGKDPFYGNTQEKEKREQLENNLKEIFKKIYDNLDKKDRYKDTTNFFQLREDWWTANRETVWKALTCSEQLSNASYFRATCSDERGGALANHKCRCPNGKNADQVPTYFDYVPQYLRWFDEWAEDFCRKRKHKLENAKNKCRRPNGKDKYCDLNRHDCKKTVRGDHVFFEDDDCNDCSVACKPFVKWIDNQKLEFEKQKKKYKSEIEKYTNGESRGTGGSKRKKRGAGKSNYDRYESKFYNKLKEKNNYGTVDGFLELLNKEKTCTKNGDIEEGGKIDFKNVNSAKNSGGDGNNKTFYRTKYCEACPWCGIEEQKVDGKWKAKNDGDCNPGKDYKNYKKTEIPILTGDKTKGNMVKKYNKFCNANDGNGAPVAAPDTATSGHNTDYATTGYCGGTNNSDKDPSLCEKWTCYYKKNGKDVGKEDINFCVQQEQDTDKKKEMSMHYNAFFWDWVYHMLHDSLDWRNELKSCIDKDKSEQCENKCNSKCDCFLKWVNEKKTEWDKIKEHFYKQEGFDNKGENGISVGGLGMTHDFVLNCLLKKDLLLKSIKDTHVDAKDIDRIDKMLKEEENQVTGVASGVSGTGSANGKNSIIDKLLDHELTDAQNCLKTHTSDPCPQQESLARSDEPQPRPAEEGAGDGSDDASSEDEEEEEEEEEEKEPEADETHTEDTEGDETETTDQEVQPPPDACSIVKTLFTTGDAKTNFKDACEQKYSIPNRYWGWKCIPSGDKIATSRTTRDAGDSTSGKDGATGGLCIPPRRRKLYVGELTKWADTVGDKGESQTLTGGEAAQGTEASASSSSSDSNSVRQTASDSSAQTASQPNSRPTPATSSQSPSDPLLTAFVESAAVETFFLWHKYKMDKEIEKKERKQAETGLVASETSDDPEHPQNQLKKGIIPDEFKRQMFYTLADYRDILFGNTDIVSKASSDDKKSMETIEKKIEEIFPKNSDSKPASGKNPNEKREQFWKKHGKDIWQGMICTLSYDTKTKDKIEGVYEKLIDTDKENMYDKVTFKGGFDEIGAGARNPDDPPTGKTKLEKFVKRPFFFRWLEEWADEFCRKQKHKLYIIKKECKVDDDDNKCDGDGFKCTQTITDEDETIKGFDCPSCAKECTKYRKWIERKKTQFEKQDKIYKEQKKNCKNESENTERNKDGNGFYETLTTSTTAAEFLQKLGPCSKTNNGGSEITFDDSGDTFKPAKDCKPCSKFKIDCQKGNCGGSANGKECKNNKITAENIKGEKNGNDVVMFVSDNSKKEFDGGLKDACEHSNIFKGIRKDVWTCDKFCGLHVCGLKNDNGKNNGQIILVRALFKRWVEYFFEDYNKIKHKISHCTKKGEEPKCIKECVENWIKEKEKEWTNLKNLYLDQYKNADESYPVKTFLEELIPQIAAATDKAEHETLKKLEKSLGCNGTENSKESKKDENNDLVLCLLTKLGKEAEQCKDKPPNCDNSSHSDETLEEQTDDDTTDKQSPEFCKDIQPPEEPKEDSDILCNDKQEAKCDDFKKIYNNSTCEPKRKLIGLGAQYHKAGRFYPNVYISPRVNQLCLKPLKELENSNEGTTDKSKLIDALKKCAYNEAKGLYKYYNDNKKTFENNGSTLSEKEIETYTLEAMKRSYADYGSIVKGDILWDYEDRKKIDEKIMNFAEKHNTSIEESRLAILDDDDVKRQKLWESIRTDVWKSMLCGHKDAIGGDTNSLSNGLDFCKLPTTDEEYPFLRWFVEWGQNFCIRRDQELKYLKKQCQNVMCNDSDESKKQACQTLCKKYQEFLINSKIQYETQKPEYDNLMSSIPKHRKKDAIEFLKEKCNPQFSCFKDINENESNKIFQHASDEIIKFCTCTSEDTSKSIPSNCIDKAAYELQKEATNKLGNASNSLKGNQNNISFKDCRRGDYVVVDNTLGKKIDKDKLEIEFPSNSYSCEPNEINSFHIGKAWDCNNTNINIREKYLCLPPRRRFMCLRKIERMITKDVDDKDKFFQVVMKAAKEEGIRILKNYKEQNKTQFSEICDDMKYSFADLGDIIRGRDLWKEYPKYHTTEQNLQRIFKNIHNEITKGGDKDKYKYDAQYFHELRNDWWNTNREAIWKAITCSTPRSAYIYKKTNTGENIRSTDMYYYCGYTKEPPYDDYIPQRLRWMKEWGEYVCKILNEKIDDIKKECDKCNLNDQNCLNKDDGNKCKSCKEKCKEYTELIHNLKSQFSILEKKYNELYTKAKNNSGGFIKDNDKYVIEFFEKVIKEKLCDVETPDKYLDKTIHCINYKFNEKEKDNETYAFNVNPKVYTQKCTCAITNDPLDKCPDQNTCTKYHAIQCFGKEHDDNAYWLSTYIKDNKAIIKNVLLPPRRIHLCLRIDAEQIDHLRSEIENFKNFICSSAFSEAKRLKKVYKDDNDKLLQAIKYSFSDIGSIVKGEDMKEGTASDNIAKIFNGKKFSETNRKKWWNENKYHVWESMLCGYKEAQGDTKKSENCRFPDIESVPQFLRWFQEWTEIFCTRRNELYDKMVTECQKAECVISKGSVDKPECMKACEKYKYYVLSKKKEYDIQRDKYDKEFKMTLKSKTAPEFLKVPCLSEYFSEKIKWENPYKSLDDDTLKGNIYSGIYKKTKSSVGNLFQILQIPKGDYDIPTLKSKNRYIPYRSGPYKGKTYIYMEGDSDEDKYAFMSDTTDVTSSSESEYEELDINDIYVPGSPKYKTLIEVVLEPSGKLSGNTIPTSGNNTTASGKNTPSDTQNDIQSDDIPSSKITDNEWNTLKDDFISNMLQNTQNTEPNMLGYNVDNNTNPKTLHVSMDEKPFITSIHDRDLYSGEEYNYNVNMSTNSMDDPKYVSNNVYSGIDLINDSLSGAKPIDIYDELLKRKENELFGTNYKKNTSNNNVAKLTNSDPIMNQLDLLHKWLDRHRDMCEKWNNKEELLDKLKEEWEQDNNSGDIRSDNHVMNTNVSIEIDIDENKGKKEFTNMDTNVDTPTMDSILDDIEDDIYYDVNDENPSVNDIPMDHNKVDVPKKVHVEMKILNNTFNGSLEPEFPISDVWNI
ncbi:erythrocyte membrane protein 1 [Plasmodium falciparum RAJ116]|uniref:Erythrocyte membrane protein 1 n=1 Tax=Plasmodium falciparum RAJ116 TaxID=580058 RepID=A0A0L0CSL1_PLAFA|nr:erythrocyte membrane protein 1 [Plasmodium falciparum RAJ116]